ncbi:MAG TPA: hypothetical protein VH187_22355 [Scandinavium sp.]|uniref:hypothetical protein n=1 Tax=Scandinavium sp. TaxID=2830653 RepID=UPI002E379076|nr:hypothetical protein [Scandinavium sp.]HEX4503878.1 hypothetical protein [Scandinavium sp.]
MEGRLLLSGLNPYKLDATQLVNVCYSMIISDLMNFEISRVEARETIDKRIKDMVQSEKIRRNIKVEPEPFHMSPAMMAQMGIKINQPAKG